MNIAVKRTALGLLGAAGILASLASAPARAEDPPFEQACNPGFSEVNCAPDRQAAHGAVATVPGLRPLQPVQQDVAKLQGRPWLGHPSNPPRGGAGG